MEDETFVSLQQGTNEVSSGWKGPVRPSDMVTSTVLVFVAGESALRAQDDTRMGGGAPWDERYYS